MTERALHLRTVEESDPSLSAVAPHSGCTIALRFEGETERIVIAAPDGATELSVRLTREGPVLELRGASIEIEATRAVAVRCERFELAAREAVVIASGGELRETAAGDHALVVGGRSSTQAHAVAITARLGNVDVKANDDVELHGERIYLNR